MLNLSLSGRQRGRLAWGVCADSARVTPAALSLGSLTPDGGVGGGGGGRRLDVIWSPVRPPGVRPRHRTLANGGRL